jgi:hypothetical protein
MNLVDLHVPRRETLQCRLALCVFEAHSDPAVWTQLLWAGDQQGVEARHPEGFFRTDGVVGCEERQQPVK